MRKVSFTGFKNSLPKGHKPSRLVGQILFTPSKKPEGPHFFVNVELSYGDAERMGFKDVEELNKAMFRGTWK